MKNEKSAMDALLQRRSVRSFTKEPVSEEQIRAILRAGMFAPSAHNRRTWEIITVTSRETLDALAPLSKWWGMLREAALCIVCCGHFPGIDPADEEFLVQNSVAATENMLLCIDAMGLGGVWLGIHTRRPYYADVKKLLNIPEDVRVVSLIAAGHPKAPLAPRAQPAERFDEHKWHREKW
ncbi:MAG TPA: nitroreductase family protein [Feifaniaceae bacterium]|nr:nitroreductase family protein [Feifaniaceae bacterium]